MEEAFTSLQERVGVKLEDPLVSQLFEHVVKLGSFARAESILTQAHQEDSSLFEEFIRNHVPYQPQWSRLDQGVINSNGNPTASSSAVPAVRGGHQMVWDPVGRAIYLFGGWDGYRDLSDLWRYDVGNSEWICLSEDTRREGGPSPRSCHKMVLHVPLRRLFVFGKYIETEARATSPLSSDFYFYDLERHTWTCLGEDVQSTGGPGLVYDHQMAVDEERGVIYVFGGRVICHAQNGNSETLYSGLYSYDINTARWRLIRSDQESVLGSTMIKSRIGHSMIFNPATRQLYIYAGQRHKDYLR